MKKVVAISHTVEWELEPDLMRFRHAGLRCVILRHPKMKHLCGYVNIPRGNKLYDMIVRRMKHRDCSAVFTRRRFRRAGYSHPALWGVKIHGGITFCNKLAKSRGLFIGFDCAHADDYLPGMKEFMERVIHDAQYRNIQFVTDQCKELAEQVSINIKKYSRGEQHA